MVAIGQELMARAVGAAEPYVPPAPAAVPAELQVRAPEPDYIDAIGTGGISQEDLEQMPEEGRAILNFIIPLSNILFNFDRYLAMTVIPFLVQLAEQAEEGSDIKKSVIWILENIIGFLSEWNRLADNRVNGEAEPAIHGLEGLLAQLRQSNQKRDAESPLTEVTATVKSTAANSSTVSTPTSQTANGTSTASPPSIEQGTGVSLKAPKVLVGLAASMVAAFGLSVL